MAEHEARPSRVDLAPHGTEKQQSGRLGIRTTAERAKSESHQLVPQPPEPHRQVVQRPGPAVRQVQAQAQAQAPRSHRDHGGAPAVRLDMDLDLDIHLEAKIKGRLELSIL